MAEQVPIIRPVNWMTFIAQVVCLFILINVLQFTLHSQTAVYLGWLLPLAALFVLRTICCRHHRTGIKLMRAVRFQEAVPAFASSYQFFSRYPILDRWRAIFLLSCAKMSYREMALVNIAFSHGQSGDGTAARAGYERTLAEFPGNPLAVASLRLMDSAAGSKT